MIIERMNKNRLKMKLLIYYYHCKMLKDQRKEYFRNVYNIFNLLKIDPEFIVKLPYKCLPNDSIVEINRVFDKNEKGELDISNDSEASLLLHLSVAGDH